jgi:hypothetical protein
MAPSDRADALNKELDKIMDFLGIERFFISDETKFWDFGLDEIDMKELQEEFGVIADGKMYVVDFALQIKQKGIA